MNSKFLPITQEQRDLAKKQRQADQEYALLHLKIQWEDRQLWSDLASKYKVRMPIWYKKGSELKYMRRVAKKVGVNIDNFVESTGFNSLKEFSNANTTWPSYALCGLLLEWVEDNKWEIFTNEG